MLRQFNFERKREEEKFVNSRNKSLWRNNAKKKSKFHRSCDIMKSFKANSEIFNAVYN